MMNPQRLSSAVTAAIATLSLMAIGVGVTAAQIDTPAPLRYSAQQAYQYMEVLAGQIGERPAGSEAEDRAVAYIAGQFKSWGLDTSVQPVHVPVWRERRARLWTDGATTVDFPAKAIVFAGLTPPQGISGEFLDLGSGSARDLRGKDLKGKIVLIKRDVYVDYPDIRLTDRLMPLGIAGMIFYSAPGRRGIPTAYFNFKRALKEPTPPAVAISYEDAARLVQMQPRQVSLVVEADVEWRDSHSVLGELRGALKPEEVVVFSAHDDTAYTSPGATDDGGGVAAVMELARAFSQAPRPARTLRFVAWGGHELGLMGSETYLRAHPEEPARIVAVINYDGLGSSLGTLYWIAAGGDDWIRFLRDTQQSIGMDAAGGVGPSGTDATNFSVLGVPSIQIGQRLGPAQNHTPADNLQYTSAIGMEDGIAFAAAIGERMANGTSLTFSHQFPPDVLQEQRDYAARWGWGVRPEANQPANQPPGAAH